MRASPVARRLADIASCQWGLITTAQARVHGVARANLAHRVKTGELERTEHFGVYRLATTQAGPLDDLRAAWLSTNPEALAPERVAGPEHDAVIAAAAAGMVHGIGNFYPAPYRVIVPGRRQSTKGTIAYSWRALDPRDVQVVDGLPVTTCERTVVDLLSDEGDVSLVADALGDALRSHYDIDNARLAELLAPHAERLGQRPGDGPSALGYLLVTAEMDSISQASRALDKILASNVPQRGVEAFLEKVIQNMSALAATSPAMAGQGSTHLETGKSPSLDVGGLDVLAERGARAYK